MVKNYEKQFKGKLIAQCTYRKKHTFRAIDMEKRDREKYRNMIL